MPPVALRLISLAPETTIPTFLTALRASGVKPLTINRVIRWIIPPSTPSLAEAVLSPDAKWDILLILPSADPLPESLARFIKKEWWVTANVPGVMLKGFEERNAEMLRGESGVPSLKGSGTEELLQRDRNESAREMKVSEEVAGWMGEFAKADGRGAVTMFNLVSFKPGGKESYGKVSSGITLISRPCSPHYSSMVEPLRQASDQNAAPRRSSWAMSSTSPQRRPHLRHPMLEQVARNLTRSLWCIIRVLSTSRI